MSGKNKENELIEVLQSTGLNYKEALIYFTLMKSGLKGCLVRDLTHVLSIERTTIYSILRKLIKHGYVKEGGLSEKSKKATIFIAIEPMAYFTNLILKKENELERLQEVRQKYSKLFQNVYQEGLEYSYEELDSFIQPYFKPLLEKGWKIISYFVIKEVPTFFYTVYDCMLQCPKAKYIKMSYFHVFIFNYHIEDDENALRFFINRLKKKIKNEVLYHTNLKDFPIEEEKIKIFGNIYTLFNAKINIEEIKNLEFFLTHFKVNEKFNNYEPNERKKIEISTRSIILPIKNKLFFLGAESQEILKEMIKPIFKVEKIPIKE